MIGLYARVSSQEQVQNGHSIVEQQERLKAYCVARDWKSYKVYVDGGFSGASTDRPALQDLIRDVEKGKIDKVLVYKLDRLSRSQKDTLHLIEDVFLKHGCDFISMTENFDTSTPLGRAMIGTLSVFAQLEREQIKERMMMGKDARTKEGKWHGGRYTPLGYGYENGELVPLDYYADQVRELFELYASGTYATAIIKLFNSKGYLTQQGKEWTCDQIRRTLRHKVYIGYIYDGHGKWYKGTHEPIVSEETFEKANEKFRQRRDNRVEKGIVSTPKQTTYLGGFLRCAHCGALYGKNLSNHGKYRYSYYSCYSRLKKNPLMVKDPHCMNKHWKMADLEGVIFAEIEKLTLEDVRKIREKRTEKEKIDTTLPIKKRIKDIDGQISRFLDLYGKGTIDFELLDERIRQLEAEKTKLSAQIPARSASNSPEESEVINLIKSFPEAVRKGSLDEIRGLLSVLIDKIELDGEDVRIFWRF